MISVSGNKIFIQLQSREQTVTVRKCNEFGRIFSCVEVVLSPHKLECLSVIPYSNKIMQCLENLGKSGVDLGNLDIFSTSKPASTFGREILFAWHKSLSVVVSWAEAIALIAQAFGPALNRWSGKWDRKWVQSYKMNLTHHLTIRCSEI